MEDAHKRGYVKGLYSINEASYGPSNLLLILAIPCSVVNIALCNTVKPTKLLFKP